MANLKYGKIGEILDLEILSEININDFLSQENIDDFNLAFYHLRHINDKEKKNGVLKDKKTIIEKETMVIGYDDDCDIVINDNETVSGHHAELTVKDDSVYIADLNSTNGTYLNEKELIYLKKYKLFDGDKIELADEVLFFRGRVINE